MIRQPGNHIRTFFSLTLVIGFIAATAPVTAVFAEVDSELMEGLEFRNIGPWRGGRSTTSTGVPGDPLTFYMGSTGGGIWKTTNGGVNWTNISDGQLETGSVGAIAVAPSDANVIYVGMGESPYRGVASSHGDGVYKSTDAGKTWTHMGLDNIRQTAGIVIDPNDPDIVYVAAQGSPWAPTEDRGVYRSKDGGENWEKILYIGENVGAIDLKMSGANSRILYAAMWDYQRTPYEIRSGGPGSGIHKSSDGGDSWEELTEGLPEEMGKIGIAPSPANPDRVWAVIEAKEKGGVYRSDDGGENWKRTNSERKIQARSWYYMHMFADPNDENSVYVLNSGMFRSVDGGKTFSGISGPHGDHHWLWINPDNSKNMVNSNDGGATVTYDGGASWSSEYNQPTAQFYRVNVDNGFPYKVYGGQQDNSTVAISSAGYDGRIGREDWYSVGGCESAHVAFDPDNPRYYYAGCYLGQISEFDMETRATRDIRVYPEINFGVPVRERKYRFNWNAPILVSQHDPSVIYHGGNRLFRSSDRGHSWQAISPDLTRDEDEAQGTGGGPITNEVSENYNTLFAVTESPHDANVIYAGSDDGLLHITRDGGENWEQLSLRGFDKGLINSIDVSPHNPGTAYVVATGYKYNDHKPYIYKTDNYGGRFRAITKGIPDDVFVRVVREDTVRPGLLYAGTETGFYVSFDDGGNWQKMQLNLPVVPITDIKVHGDDVVLSTQGRAFWILDDVSPLRQMPDDLEDEPVHLFTPKTALMLIGGGGSWSGNGANPPRGAVFYYWLKDEPEGKDKKVEFEILDANGDVIRTMEIKNAEKGLNRASWDFRINEIPKIPGVFTMGGGFNSDITGHRVAPGSFTLRLKMGDEPPEVPLVVRLDPRLEITEAEMADRQAMLEEIHQTLQQILGSARSLRAVRDRVKMAMKQAKEQKIDDGIKEAGKALIKKIDTWEAKTISPDRRFFQDVLNWPDRIDSRFLEVRGIVDGTLAPVTQGTLDRYQDLNEIWAAIAAERDQIVGEDLTAFNTLYRKNNVPAVPMPPVIPEEDEEESETDE